MVVLRIADHTKDDDIIPGYDDVEISRDLYYRVVDNGKSVYFTDWNKAMHYARRVGSKDIFLRDADQDDEYFYDFDRGYFVYP